MGAMQAKSTWRLAESSGDLILPTGTPLSELATRLLLSRGIADAAAAAEFLAPQYPEHLHDPFLFADMHRVVERIMLAIANNERLVIYGDYDADGVCSSVVLATTIRALGGEVADVYLPHRETEGYGLNMDAVAKFIQSKTKLLITLDCGTTNLTEVAAAAAGGIDIIVIDHHHVPDELPGAFAMLNPKMPSETYPYHYLASVGMAFKTSQALLKKRMIDQPAEREKWLAFEKWLLDLVSIATVTDMVPLTGENRVLLSFGLKALNKTQRPGLKALIDIMGGELGRLDTYSLGFQIGPRINAAGRMNHANTALALLLSEDEAEAGKLAAQLETENKQRQQLTEKIVAAAKESLQEQLAATPEPHVLVAVGGDWSVGVVGLVANKLMEQYHRPILVIGRTSLGVTGSGRSLPAFNLIEALHTMPELFTKFGGHAQACGFSLRSEDDIPKLIGRLNALAAEKLLLDDFRSPLAIDAVLQLAEVNEQLLSLLDICEPFGMGNPRPKFLLSSLKVVGINRVGSDQKHLRLTLSDGATVVRQAIAFNHGLKAELLTLGDLIDVVAEVSLNEWNGRRDVQLRIVDMRSALPS